MARYGSRFSNASTRRTTPLGALTNTSARLRPEVYEKLHRVAEAQNIGTGALISELIERLEVDESYRPAWRSRYAPPDQDQDDDTLPISAA